MDDDLQLSAIGEIHLLLERLGLPYWLFGGWAVDFHAGRRTREHADIDIVVRHTDLGSVRGALGRLGWTGSSEPSDGHLELAMGSLRLDLAWVGDDATSDGTAPPPTDGGPWATGAFGDDVMELEAVRARVVSLGTLLADKSEERADPAASAKDRDDLVVLRDLG